MGVEQTITVVPKKYSFPRVRNLPNRVSCTDETGEIDCVFFNSYEGYVKKILPLNEEITISGEMRREELQSINSVSAGVYLYSIEAGDFRQTKKMIFLK